MSDHSLAFDVSTLGSFGQQTKLFDIAYQVPKPTSISLASIRLELQPR